MENWKTAFRKGIYHYREGKFEEALVLFDEAINSGEPESIVYDSRAAVNEKLGNIRDALRDSKRVIDLAPQRWQGYSRSARLFMRLNKFDHAQRMAQLALDRVGNEPKRRDNIESLLEQIASANQTYISRTACHFGSLPLEIATIIFSSVVADDHTRVIGLAQVCKGWRNTILETPNLWSTLVLSHRHPVKKAKAWRIRSKGRLLDLRLCTGLETASWALDELRDMPLDTLRAFTVDGFPTSEMHSRLPNLTASVLRDTEFIVVRDSVESRPIPWLWSIPDMRVRTLSVERSQFAWGNAAQNITRLEHFSFQGTLITTTLADIASFLRANPGLRTLAFWFMGVSLTVTLEDVTHKESISLPSLTQFSVDYYDFVVDLIFPQLSLSTLQTLRICRGTHPLGGALQHLVNSGAAGSLTELKIQRCAITAESVINVLRSAPLLEVLQLEHVGDEANKVLETLAKSTVTSSSIQQTQQVKNGAVQASINRSTILCPLLKHLDFSYCPDIKSGPLIELVKTRIPASATDSSPEADEDVTALRTSVPTAQIDTLIIDGCPAVDADILPWLRSKVRVVSCVYMSKKHAKWRR
ncbi:uncharacterized protein FIBRA_05239 [Fibroporia radiculosa]|uniref:F-box domain-containing protein n=1 Tax=Fibroporia radiculosa TaxID=599839 RepID=J4G8V8_9APHY|nr:uncharacterized protein FIBRA_05239 [Fibroporia radiculosa]CCM03118.1 predicted protein [Fibroporia radiculosa]